VDSSGNRARPTGLSSSAVAGSVCRGCFESGASDVGTFEAACIRFCFRGDRDLVSMRKRKFCHKVMKSQAIGKAPIWFILGKFRWPAQSIPSVTTLWNCCSGRLESADSAGCRGAIGWGEAPFAVRSKRCLVARKSDFRQASIPGRQSILSSFRNVLLGGLTCFVRVSCVVLLQTFCSW